ncbi:MAG: choice-of-anchor D domain-containing protein [Prosthecobacter sp.]
MATLLHGVTSSALAAPGERYAWGANVGWIDIQGNGSSHGMLVQPAWCSGNVYGANIGWISLGDGTPANGSAYANLSADDFGVNLQPTAAPQVFRLSGYAYGANIGWIQFEAQGDPQINKGTQMLSGYAYSANCGWINLSGVGVDVVITDAPEIVLEQPAGTPLQMLGMRDFGAVTTGSFATLGFTIKNVGDGALDGLAITKGGANPGDFIITASPVAPVVPGASTSFSVRFNPGAAGSRTAVLYVASNDADEQPFAIQVSGSGLMLPTVATGEATRLSRSRATLGGAINPHGLVTSAQFQYGLDVNYGSTAVVQVSRAEGLAAQTVGVVVQGLMPGTTYHYRLAATSEAGSSQGQDRTFTTPAQEVSLSGFTDPNPASGNQFGHSVLALSTGNVVITAPYDDAGGTDAGAVYLFNGATGALISTLRGSSAQDHVGIGGVYAVGNGNFVVVSQVWGTNGIRHYGAVTWIDGNTGLNAAVNGGNSLVGAQSGDNIGSLGVTVLSNGNYLVRSLSWASGSASLAGAVTWGSGSSGITGMVGASNSLVGSEAYDLVGFQGVKEVGGGNYVVLSAAWHGYTGAVTWGNGATGVKGVVGSGNSLVGSNSMDRVGMYPDEVILLGNGNYLVRSPAWDNGTATDAGAVTWGDGRSGVSGVISSANSLIGSTTNDGVGSGRLIVLSNGNYLVCSPLWTNGSSWAAGAVTWGSGTVGVRGWIDSSNSLVGSSEEDTVGGGGVVLLGNGNYVVSSSYWDNGTIINAGAVTWGSGASGVCGAVSTGNSLVGTSIGDHVGGAYLSDSSGVTALTNGHYVVNSPDWNNGSVRSVGAVTWCDGTKGLIGPISSSNSLLGSVASDRVGRSVAALKNGNYVVCSDWWDNDAIVDAGAVTWCDGSTGRRGYVSSSNSLVGSQLNDRVGADGATPLSNGSFVVRSPLWSNGNVSFAGAVTWGNGVTMLKGTVSSSNSLVGSSAYDRVGIGTVAALTNGNYVVLTSTWANGNVANAGAVTWGSGISGVAGEISAQNSLIGTTADDGSGTSLIPLSNGNYLVHSLAWDNGTATDAGAVTWGDGSTGTSGVIGSGKSLVGSTRDDRVGDGGIMLLANGSYLVRSPAWDNGTATDAGAFTWGSGSGGISGVVSSSNSLMGASSGDSGGSEVILLNNGNYVVVSSSWDNGTRANAGAVTWGHADAGVAGVVSSSNSLVGSSAEDQVGSGGVLGFDNGNYVVRSPLWDNGLLVDAGALSWGSGAFGVSGEVNSENSLLGLAGSTGLKAAVVDTMNGVFFGLFPNEAGGVVRIGEQIRPVAVLPTVLAIAPSSGSSLGGTGVTITGAHFSGATSVTIGGVAATEVAVVNDTTITAVTGTRSAGVADVSVTTAGGTGTGVGLFTYVSGNATLAGLTLSHGSLSPDFNSATLSYTVTVDYFTSSLSLTPTAAEGAAVIMVNGSLVPSGQASGVLPLSQGANPLSVEVLAPDGITTRTYAVEVVRLPPSLMPGMVDTMDFGVTGNTGNRVNTAVQQLDGKVIIGGSFTMVQGVPRSGLARLNVDGTLDAGFDPRPNSSVICLLLQEDGKIVVGGTFSSFQPNGAATPTARSRAARLNPDGTLDAAFDPSPNAQVRSMFLQPDGRLVMVGGFITVQPNGAAAAISRRRIARFNGDGTLDMSFDPNAGNEILTAALQQDGRILIGGNFTNVQPNGAATATTRNRIARLNADGTLDTSFDPNVTSGTTVVNCLLVQPDGKILAGGAFTSFQPNGATASALRNRMARFESNGTLDPSFDPNANGTVSSMCLQADGKILAGGQFTTLQPAGGAGQATRNRVARLHPDGTVDVDFDPNANGLVECLAQLGDGRILLGGTFTTVQPAGVLTAVPRSWLARVHGGPAGQALSTVGRAQVLWQRGGSAAEVSQAVVDQSLDAGATWTPLGNATRVTGTANWQLAGLQLPAGVPLVLRARGRTSSGIYGGSSALTESIVEVQLQDASALWSGSDDFNDNVRDPAKWAAADSVHGGAQLVETGSRLEYRAGTPDAGHDDALRHWLGIIPDNDQAFEVILDVHNGVTGDNASIGLSITSIQDPRDNLSMELYRVGPDGSGFLSVLRSNVYDGNEVLPRTLPSGHVVTAGSLRVTYDAQTKVFTTYHDTTGSADGHQWQLHSSFGVGVSGGGATRNSPWLLGNNAGFTVSISGFSEGLVIPAGQVYADNFSLHPPRSPQQQWAAAAALAGLSGADAELDASPFQDGMTNLLKYAFNMNLSAPDAVPMAPGGGGGLPALRPQGGGTGRTLRYEFLRRVGAGLVYTPQKSSSLAPGSWQPLTSPPVITPVNATWERVVHEEPCGTDLTSRCFGRVQVLLPPQE